MLLWLALLTSLDCITANAPQHPTSYNFIPSKTGFYNQFRQNSDPATYYQQTIPQSYYNIQPPYSQNDYPAQQRYHSSQEYRPSPVNVIKHHVYEIKPSTQYVYEPHSMETWRSYAPKYHNPPVYKVIVPDRYPPNKEKVISPPPPPRIKYPDLKTLKRFGTQKSKNKFLYKFGYQQTDGQNREEQGDLVDSDSGENLSVKGSYGWMGPDGVNYMVDYTAGENGFQPNISQGPGGGVPPAVVASLLG